MSDETTTPDPEAAERARDRQVIEAARILLPAFPPACPPLPSTLSAAETYAGYAAARWPAAIARAEAAEAERDAARAEVARLTEARRMRIPGVDRPPQGKRLIALTGRGLIVAGHWDPDRGEPSWKLDRDDFSPTIKGWWPLPTPDVTPAQVPPVADGPSGGSAGAHGRGDRTR